MTTPLVQLQSWLQDKNLDAFILSTKDRFLNEFVPESEQRLTWLSGFTGSNGIALVLQDKALFFTDGRYTLQASDELDTDSWEIFDMGEITPCGWLNSHFKADCKLAYDPWIHSIHSVLHHGAKHVTLHPQKTNPIDQLWHDKPPLTYHDIDIQPSEHAGLSVSEKLEKLTEVMREKDYPLLLLAKPECVCWLLNIRSRDVPDTPLVLCYALVDKTGHVSWFTESTVSDELKEHLGSMVTIKSFRDMEPLLKEVATQKLSIYASHSDTPAWFMDHVRLSNIPDPVVALKAVKTQAEQNGMRTGHIQDGIALTQAWHWLEAHLGTQEITELSFSEKLVEFRKMQPDFIMPSFTTIAGFAEHGAIVHYNPTEKTNKPIRGGNLLLVDSGGQYTNATTDVTRVFALGGSPTKEQQRDYTLVLKGHIALASAVFPKGTSGLQLDVLARQFLWKEGLDYNHGTGHGVGTFLAVHEGPQSISKKASQHPLAPGMVISNEPGYYKEGSHGIRIESLVMVKEHPTLEGFLSFDTITCVPLDPRLIDRNLLTQEELAWIRHYNDWVRGQLEPHIEDKSWLHAMTEVK